MFGMFTVMGLSIGLLAPKFRLSKDVGRLSHEKRAELESQVKDLALRAGISQPLEIKTVVMPPRHDAQAFGSSVFGFKAGILIDSSIAMLPSIEREVILAHEISHIKRSDPLTIHIMRGGVIDAAFLASDLLEVNSLLIWPASLFIATRIYTKYAERLTDAAAYSLASQKAKEVHLAELLRMQTDNQKFRKISLWNRITVTRNGDERFLFTHPSLSESIEAVKKSLS